MAFFRQIRDRLARNISLRRVRALEERASHASSHYRAARLRRAAEAARRAELHNEALRLYGDCVDAYLESGRGRAAELVCSRILEVYPAVVRARCTRALIAIGHDDRDAARTRILDYLGAVGREQSAGMVVPALLQMAAASSDPVVRACVAHGLRDRDRPDLADAVLDGRIAQAEVTRWSRAVEAALRRPDEADVELEAEPLADAG